MNVVREFLMPSDLADHLERNAYFSPDQAFYIASEVYQPLLEAIRELESALLKGE